ncbi:programmed cell death protein 2 [Plakobranchus ocellatus]|uniref:Programmed cell death protein 2 n=1 Tax=Plakobranchus ocellatus TaxID=259542 RepID=A0AAV4AU22_9GAST|nr:programmed cell death protein 2 [Plakobranchus ocellatus]
MAAYRNTPSTKLGFIEEDTDLRLLSSHLFPSKVGGKASWLSLDHLPTPEILQCSKCSGPMLHLVQVYAPVEIEERDDTFHRTVFIFACPNSACCSSINNGNFKLPVINDFYSKDPPVENIRDDEDMGKFPHAGKFQSLCSLCGAKGTKKCSQCKRTYYCSKQHQVADWKAGHKKVCLEVSTGKKGLETKESHCNLLFKEFELVTEDEDIKKDYCDSESPSRSDSERLAEYQQLMRSPQMQESEGKFTEEELDASAIHETEDDQQFLKFKKRIEMEPDQVLRYCRGGEPLWVSAHQKPSAEDIPRCCCGKERVFEFQVMPQLLNYLNIDHLGNSLDWGTLCVYTCKDSCPVGNTYKEEFLWKQDFHGNR